MRKQLSLEIFPLFCFAQFCFSWGFHIKDNAITLSNKIPDGAVEAKVPPHSCKLHHAEVLVG